MHTFHFHLNSQFHIYKHCGSFFQLFIPKNKGCIIHYIKYAMINIDFLVKVEVVLFLGQPTSAPRKFILAQTGIMGWLGNTIALVYHLPWHNIEVVIIQLVVMLVFNLLFMV